MKRKIGWLVACLLIVQFTVSSCLVVPERRSYEYRNRGYYHHHDRYEHHGHYGHY